MTVTFHSPIINGPGPDMLVFEAQLLVDPIEGDKFHVRPFELKQGYHPVTVNSYQLGMRSPESKPLEHFVFQESQHSALRLENLRDFPMKPRETVLDYRVIATGIDLSEMGVPHGESIDSIFIQDAMDDNSLVDPVCTFRETRSVVSSESAVTG